MDQLGHTDPSFTLRVYRHGMRRDGKSKDQLRALVGAVEMAPSGTSEDIEGLTEANRPMGAAGFEPATSRV
jgi:hypothetical protein